MDPAFIEIQRFGKNTKIFMIAEVVLVLGLMVWAVVQQGVSGLPVGRMPASPREQAFLLAFCAVLLGGCAWLFAVMYLKVEVDEQEVRIRYHPFTNRALPIQQIGRADAVQYRPIRDCGGWGVRRYKWKGRCYNVSGDLGVEIALKDGKLILIGSKRHEELASAIRGRMQRGG